MKSRSLLSILLMLLSLAGILASLPCQAEYDPATEIQRLIDKAAKDIEKDKDASDALDADMKKISKAFGGLNETEENLNEVLRKTRSMNVNNLTKLAFKAGLNFTKAIPTTQIAEAATDFAFERVADFLEEKFPRSMVAKLSQNVGTAGTSTITAVQKFNWTISLNEQELAGHIRMETPELAAKEGSINEDLIILKHSQLIIRAGEQAIAQLEQFKKVLHEQHKGISGLKGGLDNDIKRLQEDIRSWRRQLELQDVLKSASEWSREPAMVTFSTEPDYDFGTASSKMNEAWQKLASGEYSCRSYHNAMWDATKGAQTQLNKQLNAIYASLRACGYTDACWARASAAAASVHRAFESQVRGTAKQQREDAKVLADGPIHSFGQSLYKWGQNEVDIVIWGEERAVKIQSNHGDWLGMSIWQYALSNFSNNNVTPRFYPLSVKRLVQSEKLLQEWQDDAKNLKDYFQKRADSANNSAAMVSGLAPTATELAGTLQPNIEIWDCFRSEGSYGYDPAMVDFEHVRNQYDRLSHFEAAFSAVSRNGEDAGRQLIEAASKNVDLTNKVVDALRGVGTVNNAANRLVASARELRTAQDGNLDISGSHIYAMLSRYGINDSGLKALDQRIKSALADPAVLENEALGQIALMPGYPVKNMVLTRAGIEDLKSTINRELSSIDSARYSYDRAYRSAQQAETSLDTALQAMRDKLEPIFPAEVPYFFKDEVLREYNESDDYLALMLRNRVGPAGQLPDSGLGSGPLIERYTALAERYHALVDPMMPVARANRYAPEMEAMLKKLQADSGRLAGLDNRAFSSESNRYSNEAYNLITRAGNEGKVEPKSRISMAYGAILGKLSEIASDYYQRQRLSQALSNLQSAINSINSFLGNPDAMGGWQAAQSWMDSIPATKSAVDTSVRGHSAIVPLLVQLDGLMERLKTIAANVDSGTLQRDTQAIRAMYADFASAYQNRNMPGLIHFLSSDWQAADGSNVYDLETTLGNSFRVFDSIVFKISGMSIQRTGNFYQVSYQAALTGRISRMQKSHEETSNVVDIVVITPDGPRIQKTTAMLH